MIEMILNPMDNEIDFPHLTKMSEFFPNWKAQGPCKHWRKITDLYDPLSRFWTAKQNLVSKCILCICVKYLDNISIFFDALYMGKKKVYQNCECGKCSVDSRIGPN
jgi:hypothetical protein